MRTPTMKSMPAVLILAGLLSANAMAQTTPPSGQHHQPSRPVTGQDMSTMDHSKMGHAPPAQSSATPSQQAPTAPASPKAVEAGHSGHGSPAPAPQSTTSVQKVEPQTHDTGHAGHGTQPQSAPAAKPSAAPVHMPGMDHSAMGHGASAGQTGQPAPAANAAPMGGHGMMMGPMQGGKPPPDARDPNAYNEGARHANFGNHEMHDNAPFGKVLVDKAEVAKGDGERGQNLEVEAWYGNDYNKAWVKLEGERRGGALEAARTELLWDRAFAPFWSTQLGIRHDAGEGGGRDWLAFGVQGLAPYWFETEATAYWRSGGELAARFAVKYEILFTSKVILEPELGANLYSRADPERGTGKGLSDLGFGLRLRYEITRKFAPYIGVTWGRQFGETADYTRLRGGQRSQTQAVAGLRLWF